jgi:hypothetical protein
MNRAVLVACAPWLGALAVSFALAWFLLRVSGARRSLGRLRRLHGNESGGVQSLAFVLTMPLFILVMMFIVQISQVIIANVMVHYAAFAAARSAIVWIPANLGVETEYENCIGTLTPATVGTTGGSSAAGAATGVPGQSGGATFKVGPGGMKYQQIQYAAALAMAPVCPSRPTPYSTNASSALGVMQRAYAALVPSSKSNTKINPRLSNKLAYSLANTSIDMSVWHRDSDIDLPLQQRYSRIRENGSDAMAMYERPDLFYEYRQNEIGWQDSITVTVTHQFALLPGPGRVLSRMTASPSGAADTLATKIRETAGIYVYPVSATVTLRNEGEKSIVPYLQSPPSVPSAGSPANASSGAGAGWTGSSGSMGGSKSI